MIDLKQHEEFVIEPTLRHIGLWAPNSQQIVLMTGLQESQYFWIDQTTPGPGPGRGPYQMEEVTHGDMWRWLEAHPELMSNVKALLASVPSILDQLHTNWAYSTAMCRIKYRTIKAALPEFGDRDAMAAYWKRYYNTSKGKGTEAEFKQKWDKYYGKK